MIAIQQAFDDLTFLETEEGFTIAGENLGDGAGRGLFDLGIRIEKGNIEPRRQRLAHGGLSRPHHAHKNHGLLQFPAHHMPVSAKLRRFLMFHA